jgi:hypothetical protein
MRYYTPLNEHTEYLNNKMLVYSKFPKWWDIKQQVFLKVGIWFIISSIADLILFKIGLIKEPDAAVILGLVFGVWIGSLFMLTLLDNYLMKLVK